MNENEFRNYLEIAKVDGKFHASAIKCLQDAWNSSGGTFGHILFKKFRARLFYAKRIAKAIPWEGNRLLDYRPEWSDDDIAPMDNITCNGDNVEWYYNADDVAVPNPNSWLNKDPNSIEYKQAVACNYWKPGFHPRSYESRVAWYRRNAGEYLVWSLGKIPAPPEETKYYFGTEGTTSVRIIQSGDVWMFDVRKKFLKFFWINIAVGYELPNIYINQYSEISQGWFPIKGKELRAPLVWARIPSRK